jgi:hypothetical protein
VLAVTNYAGLLGRKGRSGPLLAANIVSTSMSRFYDTMRITPIKSPINSRIDFNNYAEEGKN